MTDTLTPPLESIEPARFVVRSGWRGEATCVVDRHGVEWNGDRVAFSDITSLAYSTRSRSLNLIQRRVERRLKLVTGTGSLDINLGTDAFGPNLKNEHRAIYTTVLASLHAHVEPRLRAEALRRIAAGETIQIGPLALSHDHLRVTGSNETLEWRQLPMAQLERHAVVVRATIEHDSRPLCTVTMLTPDAVLLPELLAEATVPFT